MWKSCEKAQFPQSPSAYFDSVEMVIYYLCQLIRAEIF